jgi:hypothetical protein
MHDSPSGELLPWKMSSVCARRINVAMSLKRFKRVNRLMMAE